MDCNIFTIPLYISIENRSSSRKMMTMKCECGEAEMERRNVPFYFNEIYFGDYEADICPICGEVLFTEESSRLIDEMAVICGVWGQSRIQRITTGCSISTAESGIRSWREAFSIPNQIDRILFSVNSGA